MAYRYLKRGIDVAGAVAGLVVLGPVMAAVWVCIRNTMGAPVLFRQRRLGHHEQSFDILKFRTMTDECDDAGALLSDSERLTRMGRFLRKSSLDELPQLWNVLRGDMSLIGPRPLFVRYREHYTDRERRRHTVRPGITGLAQVWGRNSSLWDDRLELDVQYVEQRSFALDAKILARTVQKVVQREDVVIIPGTQQPPLDIVRAHRPYEHI